MKKIIFLILTLAIPVSIFLFLKFFGDNEFLVPVLFVEGIPDCAKPASVHLVPQIQLTDQNGLSIRGGEFNNFVIYGVLENEQLSLAEMAVQMVRIQDAFYEIGEPTFVLISTDRALLQQATASMIDVGMKSEYFHMCHLQQESFRSFHKCGLGLGDPSDTESGKLVLVDAAQRIRGIYDLLDREQTEQLILELKILKKQS